MLMRLLREERACVNVKAAGRGYLNKSKGDRGDTAESETQELQNLGCDERETGSGIRTPAGFQHALDSDK